MRVLVTGHHGYIGSVMTGMLTRAGHDVTGLDTFCTRAVTLAATIPRPGHSQGYPRCRGQRPSRV